MAAPASIPVHPNEQKHYTSPRRRAGWQAGRPGETVGSPHPSGPGLGNQGPDQGYLLKLATQFEPKLVLRPGEHAADAIAGAAAVALRRASICGRAPVGDDLEVGLLVFGFLGEAPDELVALRRGLFDEVHHTTIHYLSERKIAGLVPEASLRLSVAEVRAACAEQWDVLLEGFGAGD